MNDGVLAERLLADGRAACIVPLTFGRARIAVGPPDELWFQNVW